MIEQIRIGDLRCALILRAGYNAEGIAFFTQGEDSLQLGYMKREKGYHIRPHSHIPAPRQIDFTNEVLFIKKGRVRVNFYDAADIMREHCILGTGDVILLMEGGHGFEMIEDCEIIEVKQGPYMGERDKKRF